MGIALEIHFVFAFLVLLVALTVGWVQMGRRTMSGIIGIQVLIGIVISAWAGAVHAALPSRLWLHIIVALAAMFAYIAGRRAFDRASGAKMTAVFYSLLGLVLLVVAAWIGVAMTVTQPIAHAG